MIKNSDKYITCMRDDEIMSDLANGHYHARDWNDHDQWLSGLPEDKDVYFVDFEEEPENWNSELFGPWFLRRVVMVPVPSLHAGTTHKVVVSYIPASLNPPDGFVNRFGFVQDGIDRILEWGCVGGDCRVGFRVNSCCSHVTTVLVLLGILAFDGTSFKTTKKRLHILDPRNPMNLNTAVFRKFPAGHGSSDDSSDDESIDLPINH